MRQTTWDVQLHTVDDLLRVPEPKWLIDRTIHQQETGCIWGPPNCGKSFVALDWALSVSAGIPWLDEFDTIQSPVLYMAGEGAFSLQKRVRAWQNAHEEANIEGMYFQIRPLPLLEEDVIEEIIVAMDEYSDGTDVGLNPGLVIVDTLNQFFGGGDEVQGPDMARFVNNLRRLSHEQNLSVVIVHHSNATGQRERGHTSLRGNVDVMFEARPRDVDDIFAGVTLLNDKQRDEAKGEGIIVRFEEHVDSLVPRLGETFDRLTKTLLPKVAGSMRQVLQMLDTVESSKTESAAHDVIMEELGLNKATFHRRLAALKALKLVSGAGRGKSALTHIGRAVLAQED